MVQVVGQDASAVMRRSCWGCASVLEYTPRDYQRREGRTDYTGCKDMDYNVIVCPACGKDVKV